MEKSKTEKKGRILVSIPEEDVILLKIYAAKKRTTMSSVVHKWIQEHCSEK